MTEQIQTSATDFPTYEEIDRLMLVARKERSVMFLTLIRKAFSLISAITGAFSRQLVQLVGNSMDRCVRAFSELAAAVHLKKRDSTV